ncbi:F-type H+-transporting ATPase subunit b [Altererythrobacter atlanticus]|uniref:ATP synthase subunit b n=1 Tax=Croceibacterium atlanticum TaxID=1267766 RepID=A0A0F7KR24_9SPHN|nr:ATPase [Croceibacterium atlanticum]AKH41270.1 ATP synthase subunit b 2 [Croceibacterium atlanticum]MBB5732788.1 F-type H+-transporting ATPase subunit b [Croceibacterium atlanticum]
MPQIAQLAETYSSQIFWLLVIFGLVFFVIGRGMVPKVMDTVSLRDKQISNDLAAAQAARDQANEQEEAWRRRENENRAEAQAVVNAAKEDAAARTEKKLSAAQGRVDKKLAEAEARISAASAEAAAEIESVASEAAREIVQRLAGVEVAEPEAQAAVKKAMIHG